MRRILSYIFILAVFITVILCMNHVKASLDTNSNLESKAQNLVKKECSHESSIFCTHLPLVLIDTDGQYIEKETETWAEISVIDNADGNNHLSDTPQLVGAAVIKYRGNSSYSGFDKKQYRIEFRKDTGKEGNKDYPVMGMNASSDWVLNGPFLDRTLVRNRLIYTVSRELLSWAPETRYCEVYLNGKYQGLYLMIEPVTNEKGRLNLATFGLVSGQTAYIVRRERVGSETNAIDTYGSRNGKTSNELSISYPAEDKLTEKQRRYVSNDISEFERVLYSDHFDDPVIGYSKYLDVASFVDYYIINEFTLTTDAGYLSTYIYKDIKGKIKITVWDFNNAFNNYQWDEKFIDQFYAARSNWFNRLLQDRSFTDKVITRYRELRKGILSENSLIGLIDENIKYLCEATDRNFEVWGYTFNEHLLSNDQYGLNRDPESYDEAVEQLKSCISGRGDFMDKNIETLYQYCIN